MALVYVKLNKESAYVKFNSFGTTPIAGLSSRHDFENSANPSRTDGPGKTRARLISQSLALEKGMLSRLHLIGVVPVP